jgi:hemolysin III
VEARTKPRLRGVFHQWAFVAAIPLGVVLVLVAETTRGRVAAFVFAASVVLMFGASALYHRPNWSPSRRAWLRRLDHAGIYCLIAGTYTPVGLLALRGAWQTVVLAIVWSGCAAAIFIRLFWIGAPNGFPRSSPSHSAGSASSPCRRSISKPGLAAYS